MCGLNRTAATQNYFVIEKQNPEYIETLHITQFIRQRIIKGIYNTNIDKESKNRSRRGEERYSAETQNLNPEIAGNEKKEQKREKIQAKREEIKEMN